MGGLSIVPSTPPASCRRRWSGALPTIRDSERGSACASEPSQAAARREGVMVVAASAFDPQWAEIVAFAEPHALDAQHVVGGRGVKMQVRQRESHQEIFGGEWHAAAAELEDDVLGIAFAVSRVSAGSAARASATIRCNSA